MSLTSFTMHRHMVVYNALLSIILSFLVFVELLNNAAFTTSVSSQDNLLAAFSRNESMTGSFIVSHHPHTQTNMSNPVMVGALRRKENQAKIQSVFSFLRSFIYDTHFDAVSFETNAYSVAQQLYFISSSKHVSKWHDDEELSRQFTFVSTVFEAMELARHNLKLYAFLGRKDNELLNRMIEIDVRVLALHNCSGGLDRLIPGYRARIAECWRLLCLCGNAFDDLLKVSKELRDLFEFHRLRAEENLGNLWQQVPVEEF